MEEQQQIPETEVKNKRSTLLTILCILTFIGSGLNAFSGIFVFVFYDFSMKVFAEVIKSFKMTGMDAFLAASPAYFGVTALINGIAVAGAVLMWQLRKTGFHLYTVSQILVILSPMIFFRLPSPDFYNLVFSAIFVLLYSSNLKYMS